MNLMVSITGLMIALFGLFLTFASKHLEKGFRKYIISIFSFLTAYVCFNIISQLSEGTSGLISQMSIFLESVSSSVLMLFLAGLLMYCTGVDKPFKNLFFTSVFGLWIVYMILLIYTQFSDTIYYIDEHYIYQRGPFYPVLLVPPVLIMAVSLAAFFTRRRKLSVNQQIAFLVYYIIPLVSMVIQMFFYGLFTIVLGTAIAAFFMLVFMINDQTERYIRQEEETARLRAELMLSQLKPHFLYNTLATIGCLCNDSPEAKEAIINFAGYLRGNMDSLEHDGFSTYQKELEHTRLYLELEQLRFGEDLNVVYDLRCSDFRLPMLTLQPIAENAVGHGIRESSEGKGTVTISASV